MEDWQKEVLLSPYITCYGEKPMKIAKTSERNAMYTEQVYKMVKSYKNKIVIMNPDDPFRGKYAEKKAVLAILEQRPGARIGTQKKSSSKAMPKPKVKEVSRENIIRFVQGMNLEVEENPKEVWTMEELMMDLSLGHKLMSPSEVKDTVNYLLDKGYLVKRGDFIRATPEICDYSQRMLFYVPGTTPPIRQPKPIEIDDERYQAWKSVVMPDDSPMDTDDIDPFEEMEMDPYVGNYQKAKVRRTPGQQSILSYDRKNGFLSKLKSWKPILRR